MWYYQKSKWKKKLRGDPPTRVVFLLADGKHIDLLMLLKRKVFEIDRGGGGGGIFIAATLTHEIAYSDSL